MKTLLAKTRIMLSLITLLFSGCVLQESEPSNRTATPTADTETRLIRITDEGHYRVRDPGSRLIAEVRGDCLADREFIDRLWAEHHASFPKDQRVHYGPDASFTQIELVRGAERIVVGSWHTTERTSPRLFASHSGLESLGDRTRAEALAAEPEDYRRFRASFDAILQAVTSRKKQLKSVIPQINKPN